MSEELKQCPFCGGEAKIKAATESIIAGKYSKLEVNVLFTHPSIRITVPNTSRI